MVFSQRREAEIVRVTLELLRECHPRPIRRGDLQCALGERIDFTAAERRITRENDSMPAWGMRFGWNLSRMKAVGWIDNPQRGQWAIQSPGLGALDEFRGDALLDEASRLSGSASSSPRGSHGLSAARPERSPVTERGTRMPDKQSRAATRSQLSDVLIGANPNAQMQDGWSFLTQRAYDVGDAERVVKRANYAITVNIDRVRAGTVGWVHRFTGGVGELAAVCVFTGEPQEETEVNGTVFYAPGRLWILPPRLRPSGTEIQAAGWTTSPPYADLTNPRFANGTSIRPENLAALRALVDPAVNDWVQKQLAGMRRAPIPRRVAHPTSPGDRPVTRRRASVKAPGLR